MGGKKAAERWRFMRASCKALRRQQGEEGEIYVEAPGDMFWSHIWRCICDYRQEITLVYWQRHMQTGIYICKHHLHTVVWIMHVHFPVNAASGGFIDIDKDSCTLKIRFFVSAYTYACVLLGYCVYFTEAVLQRSIALTAADGDAVSLHGQHSYLR